MRSTARRVAELEHEARGPVLVHALKIHDDDDEQAREAAIDRYGRDRIKREDIVVWLLQLGHTVTLP
jgi:hypothetical protein